MWPYFDNVLKNCTNCEVVPNQHDLLFKKFEIIHKQFVKVGCLTDEFLADTGFIKDLKLKCVEVSRLSTCVSYMRSMCISRVNQRDIQLSVMHSLTIKTSQTSTIL